MVSLCLFNNKVFFVCTFYTILKGVAGSPPGFVSRFNTIQMSRIFLLFLLVLFLQFPVLSQTLRSYADPLGKFIGTAVNNNYLDGNTNANPSGYNDALKYEFNCVVAENAFKMSYLLPNRPSNPFNFGISAFSSTGLNRVDALLDLADVEDMRVRGHAYIWYNQAPNWLKNEAPGWSDQQLFDFAESYIMALGGYCAGRVDEWDVVNEAINDNGTPGYRTPGTWYANTSSIQGFIDHCFDVAKVADPTSLNFYNDYSIEYETSKNGFMLEMVQGMVNRGVKIDGVGLQSHFVSGGINQNFVNQVGVTIDVVGNMGLLCNITELDLRICNGTGQNELEKQGEEAKLITELFLSKPNCNSLLVWGISDKGSWIPYTFSGCDDGLLWDDWMNKKPAFYAVLDALSNGDPILNSPYSGVIEIPGTLEAENYDLGGGQIAYLDKTGGNQGEVYRNDNVDVGAADNNGYALAWIDSGEWTEYTVNINNSGEYDLTISNASAVGGGQMKVFIDDVDVTGIINMSNTGDWSVFENIVVNDINLPAGDHILKLLFVNGGFNLDKIDFQQSVMVADLDLISSNIDLYPIPAHDQVYINTNDSNLNWTLNNTSGQHILKGSGLVIPVKNLEPGIYLVQIEQSVYKIVKE